MNLLKLQAAFTAVVLITGCYTNLKRESFTDAGESTSKTASDTQPDGMSRSDSDGNDEMSLSSDTGNDSSSRDSTDGEDGSDTYTGSSDTATAKVPGNITDSYQGTATHTSSDDTENDSETETSDTETVLNETDSLVATLVTETDSIADMDASVDASLTTDTDDAGPETDTTTEVIVSSDTSMFSDTGNPTDTESTTDTKSTTDIPTSSDTITPVPTDTGESTDTAVPTDTRESTDTSQSTDTTVYSTDTETSCTGCSIGGDCLTHGTINSSNECQRCDITQSRTSWSAREGHVCESDEVFCNGTETCNSEGLCESINPPVCQTSVSCLVAYCDESLDQCSTRVDDDYCYINNTCVADGTPNSSNPCELCDAGESRTSWHPMPEGTFCGDGEFCNGQETCDNSGSCVEGPDPDCSSTLQCLESECDESLDQCVTTISVDYCFIGGTCYEDGHINSSSPCLMCDSLGDDDAWSYVNEGTECGECEECNDEGMCVVDGDHCLVEGECYTDDFYNPDNPCQKCDISENPEKWTNEDAQTNCGECHVCDEQGECVPDQYYCFVNDVCYPDGETNDDGCLRCDSEDDPYNLQPVNQGSDCGDCMECNSSGQCAQRDATCCDTSEAGNFLGYCGTAPERFLQSGCVLRWEASIIDNGSENSEYQEERCVNGSWEEHGNSSTTGSCSLCTNGYTDEWFYLECSVSGGYGPLTCTNPAR